MRNKWRNNSSASIPAPGMQPARMEADHEPETREECGDPVVAPVRTVGYDLDALTAGISDDNRHGVVSFGEPVGKEIW